MPPKSRSHKVSTAPKSAKISIGSGRSAKRKRPKAQKMVDIHTYARPVSMFGTQITHRVTAFGVNLFQAKDGHFYDAQGKTPDANTCDWLRHLRDDLKRI